MRNTDSRRRLPGERAVARRQQRRAERADGRRFGGRGEAEHDGAEHRQDQQRQREERLQQHHHHLAERHVALVLGQRRRALGLEDRQHDHVDDVHAGEEEARHERGRVELDHRQAGHRAVDDQHDRRRDQDAQAAAGADHARGQPRVVAGLHHLRERQQAHQRDHRADDAGGGGEQRAGGQRGHRQRARDVLQRDLQAPEQVVEDVGALDQIAHQQEQRDRHQRVVVEHREGVLRQQVEDAVVEEGLVGPGSRRSSRSPRRAPSA